MKDTSILLEPRSSSRKLVGKKKFHDQPIEIAKTNVKTTKLRDWLLELDLFLSQNLQSVDSKQILDSIEMLPVIDCEVAAIGYCDLLSTFQVDYRNGTRYRYYNVAPATFDLLLQTTDLRRYIDLLHQSIATYERHSKTQSDTRNTSSI